MTGDVKKQTGAGIPKVYPKTTRFRGTRIQSMIASGGGSCFIIIKAVPLFYVYCFAVLLYIRFRYRRLQYRSA